MAEKQKRKTNAATSPRRPPMPKSSKRAAKPKTEIVELPRWVRETRDELSYVLLITDERSDSVNDALESIFMSRDEYIALKLHLAAALRGYKMPKEAAAHAN